MIISINLSETNVSWLKVFNARVKKAIGANIGVSMIVNTLIGQARGAELTVQRAVIDGKTADMKRRALDGYSRKLAKINKKQAGIKNAANN